MANLSDQFAAELIGNTVDVLRFAEGARARLVGRLFMLRDELIEKLMALDGTDAFSFREKKAKLTATLLRTEATIRTAYRDLRDAHLREMTSLAQLQNEFVPRMFNDTLGVSVVESVFTVEQLKAVARNSLVQGSPSGEWWGRQATALRQKFEDQMRMGYLQNETVGDLVRRVRGASTGKRITSVVDGKRHTFTEFKGGIMDVSTRNAEALVRTSIQTLSNDVIFETYEGNDDLIKGLQALATLDFRTTEFCQEHDHQAWYIDGYRPIPPNALPWPGRPPYHWNCRTVLVPLTYSWEELVKRAKGSASARRLARKVDKSIEPGTRASMDGAVSKEFDYDTWYDTQSSARQIQISSVLKTRNKTGGR